MNKHFPRMFSLALILAFLFTGLQLQPAQAISPDIVISQVYGGGGNSGATYTNDFIELFNLGTTPVSLSGWSVQYASSTGTSWAKTDLSGTLQPGQYYLVQQAQGAGGTTPLPTPDATGTIAMSATNGKVALVNNAAALSGSCPTAGSVDFVGYGSANCFEGSGATPTLSNTTAAIRNNSCIDSDNNGADFAVGAPTPRNTASPLNLCVTPTNPTGSGAANPDPVITGNSTLLTVDVIPGTNPTSTGLAVTGDLSTIGGSAAQLFFDDGTNGDVTAGDNTFSFLATVSAATSAGAKSLPVSITDAQARSGSTTISLTVQASAPAGGNVVISQVYGGGGNSGATLTNDFIELYNRSGSSVNITGWSVQYASSSGTTWSVTALSGSLAPGQYYLVQQAAGSGGTTPLPTPDATGTIAMSATNGKVALVNNAAALSGSCPIAGSVDFVGYGSANCFEGSGAAPGLSNTTAALRAGNGATDTDNNSADFTAGAPNPRNSSFGFDAAPSVSSTNPADGALGVLVGADISISFSEPVDVAGSWFNIICVSGSRTATLSGGPTSFTLNPDTDFAYNDSCTVTILASQVSDQDANDPPDNMAADYSFSFSTEGADVCTLAFTPAYAIQGSGLSTPIPGVVTTQGVVVGDFEGSTSVGIQGFYLQDLSGDGDPATSDGIFVYTGNSDLVSAGQVVRVTGFARERFNQTALNGSNSNTSPVPAANIVSCGTGSVAATDVFMPFPDANYLERFEGMLVRFPQSLVISEYFNYDRFGEMVIALPLDGETRPFTGTAIDAPGVPANARTLANSLRRITLDDGLGSQNPASLRHPNGAAFALDNRFRGGDTLQNTVGVLGFDFSLYRIQPTGPAEYTPLNPRPAAPEPVGGSLRVAAMNTLNYFITADYPLGNPLDNTCGPLQNVECRGWDSDQPDEFTRQRTKLLAALTGLDADIIGLNELENTTGVDPLADIVAGLPGYSTIDTGVIGSDAIRVGLIYRSARVAPVGAYQILDSTVDPRFIDTKSRPALAQTFQDLSTGGRFTVVVNHLKSKGSACLDVGDPDLGDGQGNCNGTRTLAAQALVDWLATDPTGSGDPDFIIMGDLNSYTMEDPIAAIKAGSDDTDGTGDDYANLISHFQGTYAYSYVFDGQFGYLDHVLANASMLAQVTGAADWHINSDESDVLDYDTSFKPPSQDALYEPNGYRSSDHDPVIVGLNVVNYPPELGEISVTPDVVAVGSPVSASAPFSDPDALDTHTAVWDWGDGTTSAGTVTEANGAGQIAGAHAYTSAGIYTVQVTVQDNFGNSDQAVYEFVVVYDPNGGFVTGGGWINSPAGAYTPDPTLTGKANFGFVAKYKKGANAPDGNTEFQFKAGDVNFKSSSYDWLVVAGTKAQFKGTGTINGSGQYKFMITANDGSPDTFRIKIWLETVSGEQVIYDNGPDQPLGGGSIVIHK